MIESVMYYGSFFVRRILGQALVVVGIGAMACSLFGMLLGAGGAPVDPGTLIWGYIGGKVAFLFGWILRTS